jgi:DNA repair protein RadA
MSYVNDLQLEDLAGVEPHLISKLKNAGIQSVLDLAVSIPHELAIGGVNYEGNGGIASDIETISELVLKAKKALMDLGILYKEFCTAEQVLERRKSLVRFTTGSENLDIFLKGGVETQAITEITGEFGTGKSQICHTLCVTANLGKQKGILDSIIFIDTENTFRPERIHQIAEARGLDSEEIMKRVFVCKVNNSAQLEAIIKNLSKSVEEYKAKLVIIDSIISLHRAEFPGRETLAERQQRLNVMLHKLIRVAEIYNIAVVVTNQVQASPTDNNNNNNAFGGGSGWNSSSIKAAGGNIMGHACTYRIFLRRAGHDRIAIMVDSPYHHAYDKVRFTISEKGVENSASSDEQTRKTVALEQSSESGW